MRWGREIERERKKEKTKVSKKSCTRVCRNVKFIVAIKRTICNTCVPAPRFCFSRRLHCRPSSRHWRWKKKTNVKRKSEMKNSSAEHIVCIYFIWNLARAMGRSRRTRQKMTVTCEAWYMHMVLNRRCSVYQLPRDDANKQGKWNNWFLFERKLIKRMKWGMFLKRRLIVVGPRFAFEIAMIFCCFFISLSFISFSAYILRHRTGLSYDWGFAGLQTQGTSVCFIAVFLLFLLYIFFSLVEFVVLFEFVVFSLNLNRISSWWIQCSISLSVRLFTKHQ